MARRASPGLIEALPDDESRASTIPAHTLCGATRVSRRACGASRTRWAPGTFNTRNRAYRMRIGPGFGDEALVGLTEEAVQEWALGCWTKARGTARSSSPWRRFAPCSGRR